jgi:uncharacterized RDD family membrane protein YckC
MTQPPDERPPRPDEPEGDAAPENAPTVAWTPPESEGEKPAEEGGTGWAAVPDETASASDAGTPPPPETPDTPKPPVPAEPVEPVPPPAAPGGPIISATPTPPASGWQTPAEPAAPGVPPVVPPSGGWEMPTATAALPQQQGYVISGIGARVVAWLIDILLAGLIPGALALAFVDWTPLIRDAVEQAQLDPSGRVTGMTYTIPITLDYILATLIGLGIQFLYFVGFWTSRWQATPGMIGLKMRVVDANTGSTLSVTQATKRWVALGWPLALLALVPALQAIQSLLQFGLTVFLFFTTVTNDRKQGLHDKFANSLVIRSVTSGNGATFAGCLVWGVLVILISFLAFTVFFAAAMPELQEIIRQNNPNAT